MTEFKRISVTAPPGPQMRLAHQFPAIEYDQENPTDTIELISTSKSVHRFIDVKGKQEGWRDLVTSVSETPITDTSTLPYAVRGLIDEGEARVWDFARELIPSGDDLKEYIWHNRVSLSFKQSVVDKKNASPATIEQLTQWVEDEYFAFTHEAANPTQNPTFDGGDGPIFRWAKSLSDTHPEAQMMVQGSLRAPRTHAPHGYAVIDGIVIKMRDSDEVTDDIIEWAERRFVEEYDAETDTYTPRSEDHFIGRADEFNVYTRESERVTCPHIRMWWD